MYTPMRLVAFALGVLFVVTFLAADKLTPGGLVYAQSFWGDTGKPVAENRMKIRVIEYPGDASEYFWSQQFFYAGSNEGGYVGIQTGGLQKGRRIGKKLIFAVWNVTEAEPGKGAVCEPFTGEGDGMTCSMAFDWKTGEEYIAAVKIARKKLVGTITESKTGKVLTIGTMPFAKGFHSLSHGSMVWIEYFGDAASCAATPVQRSSFTPDVSDGLTARLSNVTFGQKCPNANGKIAEDARSLVFTTGGNTVK
ncbi:MAG: DUF3472 domain-containing protein [Spirochaetes bacterium]|nr:DUF3472 domain-containing protein [Spirochaetota bacterium]